MRYGGGNYKDVTQTAKIGESFGFDFRLYFGATVEEVTLQPFIKLAYNGALGYTGETRVEAVKYIQEKYTDAGGYTATPKWDLTLMPDLGLTIVSLYLEPSLGLSVKQNGSATDKNVKEAYGLGYDVYAEIYITPLKNLEWYFEASIGNVNTDTKGVAFAGTTGITWYLSAL